MALGARALPVPAGPAPAEPVPEHRAEPLWLAVFLPWLAGEVLSAKQRVQAVSEETPRGGVIYRAAPEVRRQGIHPGMTLSAAHVLWPGLVTRRRSRSREQRRLDELGDRMLAFSPVVSLEAPETVLIEVRGSLGLFGGLEQLKQRIGRTLDAAGHVHLIAGAPTPSAAACLARWGRGRVVTEKAALRSALGAMPVSLLDLEPGTAGRLERAGLRVVRDLWRLPADGLGRRFGRALVRTLARLRGVHPDPRPRREPAPYFSARLMLDWATDDLAQIQAGVEQLLERWVDYLRRSARATSGFCIDCLPERGEASLRVDIGMRHIGRDMAHFRRLVGERLGRVRLAGPVAGLALRSDRIHPFPDHSGQLFETAGQGAVQWRQTEELVTARLGGGGLAIPSTAADHRPERAWRLVSCPEAPAGDREAARGRRPLWLLDPPQALPRGGAESGIVTGPERIETGWWDRRDECRDYYIARDPRGRRLWIFRDLRQQRWYLHGLFG